MFGRMCIRAKENVHMYMHGSRFLLELLVSISERSVLAYIHNTRNPIFSSLIALLCLLLVVVCKVDPFEHL